MITQESQRQLDGAYRLMLGSCTALHIIQG